MCAHRPLLPYRCNVPKRICQIPQTTVGKKKTNDNTSFLIFENYISIKRTKNILNIILAENSSRTLLFQKQQKLRKTM